MRAWIASNLETLWSALGFIWLLLMWAFKTWLDTKYETKRNEEQERAHKADHRKETEQMCDEWYVRRQRYHDDINTISEQIGRVRLDMEKANVAIAIIGTTMTNIAETSKEQGATLRAILLHTQELNRRDAAWKPETGIPATE